MVVGIFSRDSEVNYRWLADFLRTLSEDVDSVYIGNTFRPNTERYNFAILYHSMTRGRINITDVADALYDEELRTLSSALGQKNVIVVIDDLHNNGHEEKTRILQTQPSIGRMARELLLFSKDTKHLTDTNRINISNKEKIKEFIPRTWTREVSEIPRRGGYEGARDPILPRRAVPHDKQNLVVIFPLVLLVLGFMWYIFG